MSNYTVEQLLGWISTLENVCEPGSCLEKKSNVVDQLRAHADKIEECERVKARLNWAANELLACDHGDNDRGGSVVGWIVYGWRHDARHIPHSQRPRIFGASIDIAIDAALAKLREGT